MVLLVRYAAAIGHSTDTPISNTSLHWKSSERLADLLVFLFLRLFLIEDGHVMMLYP